MKILMDQYVIRTSSFSIVKMVLQLYRINVISYLFNIYYTWLLVAWTIFINHKYSLFIDLVSTKSIIVDSTNLKWAQI